VSWLHSTYLIGAMYIVAFGCFILGMSGLTGPRSAVRGNKLAAVGMAVAVIAVLLRRGAFDGAETPWLIAAGIGVGTAIGVPAARKVRMTAMPQMVAVFNGVGGGAVALVAWLEFRHQFGGGDPLRVEIPSLFAAIVGAISLCGSNIAFAKLQGILPGRPITLPWQTIINLTLGLVAVGSAITLAAGVHDQPVFVLGVLVVAVAIGNLLVLPIGGADMPVVISLLNAFTGLSAAATGLALDNTAMIVAGMIVGASGSNLTIQMARAMNRPVAAIITGGFGGTVAAVDGPGEQTGTIRSTSAEDVAIRLAYAERVMIAPGYGMASGGAQHAVRDLELALEAKGVTVMFAIHPVAGRMPGHMNVLLAEADVPYELLLEMEEANQEFPRTDVTLVIGANDVVNPDAHRSGSPIHGMPILEVDRSRSVIVLKRGGGTGYAGIDNPLFYRDDTMMLYGNAKDSVSGVAAALRSLESAS
jgi:H+-translocating NAD(P) transhydrogenase subunit beta